ncbi:heterokaryon incompatibility protein-domain-containing protein, partial [Amylocarpus encephaloides]
ARNEWIYPPIVTEFRIHLPLEYKDSFQLCYPCRNLNLNALLSSFYYRKDDCVLCQILFRCLQDSRNKDPLTSLLNARQDIRICAVPGPQCDYKIPPGFPRFLQSGSQPHFDLIKEWIRLCNQGKCTRLHGCCPDLNTTPMPTRVIDVGDGRTARLVLTDIDKIDIPRPHYVALSHCWGNPTEEQKNDWTTTTSNMNEWTKGFLVTKLPQTFQDAIKVTRELGQQYLWIDSLCIIQGDLSDWNNESKKMEAVFKNAYYTIAATSAEDLNKGFLSRPLLEEKDSQYVTVATSSHGKVFVCTSIDDFDSDVVEGGLNKRAWVLQERALSRRIIHFTKRQTYWECGGGVRCETLTHMTKNRSSMAQIELIQSLFTDYSNLGITERKDRPVAIDSLATALANALETNVRYGIFERFLHKSVLWQRSQNIPLEQIPFAADKAPPSWSWMAYHGQIRYPQEITLGGIEWDKRVHFVKAEYAMPPDILETRVRRLQNCEIKPEGVISDMENNKVGNLHFDTQLENDPLEEVRCAIIGRDAKVKDGGREYHVLFVASTQLKFRRVGMGTIQQRFIMFDGQDDTAQIV